jgi:O-acetyl-ADP-ribose deacetylase (regulator of RNase III)
MEPVMNPSDGRRQPVLSHQELVRELRILREKGVIRLRRLRLPTLDAAARAAGLDETVGGPPTAVETLLRTAVAAMGNEEPGLASQYLFGLVQGTIGHSPTDLRERAARVFNRSPETFRKERERLLIDRIADEILLLCMARIRTEAGIHDHHAVSDEVTRQEVTGPDREPALPADPARPAGPAKPARPVGPAVRGQLTHDLQQILLEEDSLDARIHRIGTYGPYLIPMGDVSVPVTVHLGAAELLRGIDIITTSANVYLDPSRTYAATLAGRIRAAAAIRNRVGSIVRDEVADELAAWAREHATTGRAVPVGTVVPTSPGRLAERGVRRLYHAAVAEPLPASNGYTVSGTAISRAVLQCFDLARSECTAFDPPLRSISLPLFGTGRAGLEPPTSFSWLWPALVSELQAGGDWHLHFSSWHPAETATILRGLHRHLDQGPGLS